MLLDFLNAMSAYSMFRITAKPTVHKVNIKLTVKKIGKKNAQG